MPSEASKPSGPHKCLNRMVPTEGVEPTRPRGHQILSLARLPVPPRRHYCSLTTYGINQKPSIDFATVIATLLRCETQRNLTQSFWLKTKLTSLQIHPRTG